MIVRMSVPAAKVVADPVPVQVITPLVEIVPVQIVEPFFATVHATAAVGTAVEDQSHVEQFDGTVIVPLATG